MGAVFEGGLVLVFVLGEVRKRERLVCELGVGFTCLMGDKRH